MTCITTKATEMTPGDMYRFLHAFLRSSHDLDTAVGVYSAMDVLAASLMKTTKIPDWEILKDTLTDEQRHAIAENMTMAAQDLIAHGHDPHGAVAHQLIAIGMHAGTLDDPIAICVGKFIDQVIQNRTGSFPNANITLH